MKQETSINMTEGNIARVLLSFAIPIFISNLFQQFYNVVDIAVIGHVLGDDALAAVLAVVFLVFLNPLLVFLKVPESIMGLSVDYISIIISCVFITFAYNLLSSMLRAVGNSRVPLYALVLTNIGTVAMQGAVNSLGTSTITGHASARKFHDLVQLPFGTLSTSCATFVSQNFGAKKIQRIKGGIKITLLLGSAWALFVLAITVFFGRAFIHALTGTSDATVLSVAMKYLCWNVPFYFILNGLLVMRNSLQAIGSKVIPVTASLLELIGKFVCVFLFVPMIKYLGICLVEPVTWIVCLLVVVIGFGKLIKRVGRNWNW